MSQENIEFMRAVYETWNSGDMDAFERRLVRLIARQEVDSVRGDPHRRIAA
jgi:hypothetical protein